jgi:hypothetical protein
MNSDAELLHSDMNYFHLMNEMRFGGFEETRLGSFHYRRLHGDATIRSSKCLPDHTHKTQLS